SIAGHAGPACCAFSSFRGGRAGVWNQSRLEGAPHAAPDYETGGQEVEILWARQKKQAFLALTFLFRNAQGTGKRHCMPVGHDVVKLARESAVAQLYTGSLKF